MHLVSLREFCKKIIVERKGIRKQFKILKVSGQESGGWLKEDDNEGGQYRHNFPITLASYS